MISINRKQTFLLLFYLGICQLTFGQSAPDPIDLDLFRTPEAAAFKRYGEESVNEYTGTADISVPLYTIKSKDIEIPLVLRYDASGIKVEQEASWVGLGWNLMVGGCINYVCAGGHDMYLAPSIPNSVWTEYLTSEFSPWTSGTAVDGGAFNSQDPVYRNRTMYYQYNSNDRFNWMNKLPYGVQNFVQSYVELFSGGWGMKEYLDWGYGERDFYSVNVMGKSFMFFIDPFTLKVFNIGKSGEDFVVSPTYNPDPQSGIGKQPDVESWTITDSDGYIYNFEVGDKCQCDGRTGLIYTSCWYLTKIQTPVGETVEFEYASLSKNARQTMLESYRIPEFHEYGAFCCRNAVSREYTRNMDNENSNMSMVSHYLRKITTGNQTLTFITSNCDENSGKKLDAIEVKSNDTDSRLIRTLKFSYGSFDNSNIGGNYAPNDPSYNSEYRLKLDRVEEIASSDTLATRFSYNEATKLPSKRSCAQDYWGYYNGRANYVQDRGYSLIPSPLKFMTSRSSKEIEKLGSAEGADRFSRGDFMQAATLNKVIYPTGGYTTYEYEANRITTGDFTLTEKYRDGQYDVNLRASYSESYTPSGLTESGNRRLEFSIPEEAICDLLLSSSGDEGVYGNNLQIEICRWNEDRALFEPFRVIDETFQSRPNLTPILQELTLPAGRYYIGTSLDNSSRSQMGYTWHLKGWYSSTITGGNYPLECGGLRIKQISNFNHDNELINYTVYDYSDAELLNRIETIDYQRKFNFNPEHDPIYGNIANQTHSIDIYTINPGHSRMPAFFTSCNPGVVGYSSVTKSKYGRNNNLEKKIITSYKNDAPTSTYGMDYYTSFNNGQMLKQEVYEGNRLVARTENNYTNETVDHYATNIVAQPKSIGRTSAIATTYTEFRTIYNRNGGFTTETVSWSVGNEDGLFDVIRYPYILCRSDLSRTTTTEYNLDGSTMTSTKRYSYNEKNHRVSQIEDFRSNNLADARMGIRLGDQSRLTKITYSVDRTDVDNICYQMTENAHRLNDVVEKQNILKHGSNEFCIDIQRTDYLKDTVNDVICYLPSSVSISTGGYDLETRTKYRYDDSLNVCSVSVDSLETVYLWSYRGQYPIAKIEGLTYAEVQRAVGADAISALISKNEPSEQDFFSIRDSINSAGGYVTTYTHSPLVGMTSETLPNGVTVRYEYDALGRLKSATDTQGHIVSSYQYHYKY